MDGQIDVVCLVILVETGRTHPATFRFIRDANGKVKQSGEQMEAQLIGFHPDGFVEPDAALRLLKECGTQATYYGPGFTADARCDMAGSRFFLLRELRPYSLETIKSAA